jgi:hypothetical protein
MPHQSLKLIPGVDVNKTPALNEAAISDSQLVRFIPDRTMGGLVQKLGGWAKYYSGAIGSIIRCLWAWEDTNANSYLAVGAEGIGPIAITGATHSSTEVTFTYTGPLNFKAGTKIIVSGVVSSGSPSDYNGTFAVVSSTSTTVVVTLTTTQTYVSGGTITGGGNSLLVITSGSSSDITPQDSISNIAVNFATVAGSNVVTVTDPTKSITAYDVVNIKTQISAGGLILFGQYQCINNAPSAGAYTINAVDVLGSPQNATFMTGSKTITGASGTGSLATVTFAASYTFPIGSVVTISGVTPSGYNGTYIVTASTSTSVTYVNTTTAAFVSGGTASNIGSVPLYSTTLGSDFVIVTLAYHGYAVGETFSVLIATTVGGITLYGNFTILTVYNDAQFLISGPNLATGTESGLENAGNAYLLYHNGIGPQASGSGYGKLPYGYGGYGTGIPPYNGAGTPITATDWTLDNWGAQLISCPLNGPVYQWDPASGNPVAQIIPNAPTVNAGVFVAMPQRQVIAWGSTFTGVLDPMLIRWSDVNDYDEWIALVTNQAGSYRLPKGSRIVQCIQAAQQALVWTDLGIWAMQYSGPPYVYQFNELGTGCGLVGRKAAGSVSGIVYWMGQSQFYRLAGSGVEPVRCPVWDVVFQDLDTTNLDKIRFAANSRFGEVAWHFPTISNGGENEGYVKYNYVLDQWDYGFNNASNPYVSRSAWINESVLGPPIGAALNQYIYQHEVSQNADNVAMNSSFQTGYFVLTEADVKMFIDQVWPDMKWGYYGGTQGADILLTFYVTDYPGQTPLTYGPYTLNQATTYVTPRFRGRLVSIKIESNDIDSFWRLGNFRYRIQPDGRF